MFLSHLLQIPSADLSTCLQNFLFLCDVSCQGKAALFIGLQSRRQRWEHKGY